ncbi:MAG: Gfo/Idh/MocA family oxidoreductase [Armatimonadetes bacterium]|nr:Gfo/Idh/MocA family oxidoreductase [Armatimonadota bacterium]
MAASSPIGFGIIGGGLWGNLHARVYSGDPRARLAAVCDLDESRAKATAQANGAGRWHTDWRNLLEDPDVQAVSIVTPDFAHTKIAVAAARAGKHILLEKPMAQTVPECEAILSAAESAGVLLMVDFHARWSPPLYKAWESVQSGEIGEPVFISYRLNDTIFVPTKMLAWAARSSVAYFIGSHALDTVLWLMNDEVTRVFCVTRSRVLKERGIDTPDFYHSTLEFARGGVAVVENGWILPESTPNLIDLKCEVVGSAGALYIDQSHHRTLEKYTQTEATYPDTYVLPQIYGQQQGFAAESIRHFIECVRTGATPEVTGRDGLRITRLICALDESARAGQPVAL